MYCAPTHPAPQKIILGTLLHDTAFFKERNLEKYLHTELAHIPGSKPTCKPEGEYNFGSKMKINELMKSS